MKLQRGVMEVVLVWCVLWMGVPKGFAYQTSAPPMQAPPQAAQQSPEQLQQLVAPIALYPDALIAQIMAAATYPDQIVDAGKWVGQHKDLAGDSLAKEVDKQPWDASVKALIQFPAVLANMNQNLAWTSELGDAYVNQQQALTQAIQTMRQRAKEAGNLNSTSQQKVSTKDHSIVIEPAEPEVVYVPQYDPWLVYGDPLAIFPGWYPYPGLYLDGFGIGWGLGFGIGFFGGYGWGWHHWGFDWHHDGRVVYNHNTYISRSRAIVNRNGFQSRGDFDRGGNLHGGSFGNNSRPGSGEHTGAFSGFSHGGITRSDSFRGQSSFGGFHGGGFHGGGRR
jgi:hypothetical protein